MKFDICLMNPPFGSCKAGNANLHFEFADSCNKISQKNVVVMPSRMLHNSNKKYDKWRKIFDKTLISAEEIDSSVFDDTNMDNVAIYLFIGDKANDDIHVNLLNGYDKHIKSLLDVSTLSDFEIDILKYLDNNDNVNVNPFRPIGDTKYKFLNEFATKFADKLFSKNKYILSTNLANGGMNGTFISKNTGIIYDDKKTFINDILKTKGSCKQLLGFETFRAAENCKAAMQNPVLRFALYKTQDDQNMTKRVYRYVPNIDWSDDHVKTDEGLLEVCGCPKDKIKEYVDYCKNIINKVDNGERP